jgi:ketosteroid isomerase-like protein
MSQENVEVVRQAYERLASVVDERAIQELIDADLVAADAEIDLRSTYPDGGVVGVAGMVEYFNSLPWSRSMRFETESIQAVGPDRVLVFVSLHGTGSGSGVAVEGHTAHLVTLRDHKVVRTVVYIDRAEALEAAGLRG